MGIIATIIIAGSLMAVGLYCFTKADKMEDDEQV